MRRKRKSRSAPLGPRPETPRRPTISPSRPTPTRRSSAARDARQLVLDMALGGPVVRGPLKRRSVAPAPWKGAPSFLPTRTAAAVRRIQTGNVLVGNRTSRRALLGRPRSPAARPTPPVAVAAAAKRGRVYSVNPVRDLNAIRKRLCDERRERRRDLFRAGVAGKGKRLSPGGAGGYRWDSFSFVRC